MKAARWTVMLALAVVLYFCVAANIQLQIDYTKSMPRSPQPSTGRIYPVDVSHDVHRYVTQQELTHSQVVQLGLYPLALVCLIGIGVAKVAMR
ncbi:MAG: hypothetical protein P4M01_06175 [Acidobacteriota bacterium]|nr:hypothetical protein [Acidobacteriota bacterium]